MNIFIHVRVLVLMLAVGGTCLALADGGEDKDSPSREKASRRNLAAVSDAKYKTECSSCHMLYPPGLLPARSWKTMLDGLKDHFGENAMVDQATKTYLLEFLTKHSADHSAMRRSQKIARSIPANETPVRFTETQYFKRQHHEIGKKVWQRKSIGSPANCKACHAGAETGEFSEDNVRIPR